LATNSTQYLIDKKGKKRAVLVDINEYSRLLERLEELEDALDMDKSASSTQGFTDYRKIREELVREGRL